MSFPRIINDLDSHLKSGRKRKEALQSLLLNGRISRNTLDLMEKKISRVTSIVQDLKETLEAEEFFWKSNLSEETRILEALLIELELKRLLGEIGEEEWTQKSQIINLGLDSLRNNETLTGKIESELALPIQTTLEEDASEKIRTTLETEDKRDPSQTLSKSNKDIKQVEEENIVSDRYLLNKRKRRVTKEPPELESSLTSRVYCMNPWNPECRDTDIELSIYYNGRMIPICRRCWEHISKKNVEWSSL